MDQDLLEELNDIRDFLMELEGRLEVLEAAKPEPLTFPPIDLGMIPGTGANHPFEPFPYTERN